MVNTSITKTIWVKRIFSATAIFAATTIFFLLVDSGLGVKAETTPMGVSAHVESRSTIIRSTLPSIIDVTPPDVQSGTIKSRETAVIWISSNDRSGFDIRLSLVGDLVRKGSIAGFNTDVEVSPGRQTVVHMPYVEQSQNIVKIDYEFDLQPSARVGKYLFPLHLEVAHH